MTSIPIFCRYPLLDEFESYLEVRVGGVFDSQDVSSYQKKVTEDEYEKQLGEWRKNNPKACFLYENMVNIFLLASAFCAVLFSLSFASDLIMLLVFFMVSCLFVMFLCRCVSDRIFAKMPKKVEWSKTPIREFVGSYPTDIVQEICGCILSDCMHEKYLFEVEYHPASPVGFLFVSLVGEEERYCIQFWHWSEVGSQVNKG